MSVKPTHYSVEYAIRPCCLICKDAEHIDDAETFCITRKNIGGVKKNILDYCGRFALRDFGYNVHTAKVEV